jgi:hypothetical protein
MENVEIIEIETMNGKQAHAIINHGNGKFTSMPKEIYDEQLAANEASFK